MRETEAARSLHRDARRRRRAVVRSPRRHSSAQAWLRDTRARDLRTRNARIAGATGRSLRVAKVRDGYIGRTAPDLETARPARRCQLWASPGGKCRRGNDRFSGLASGTSTRKSAQRGFGPAYAKGPRRQALSRPQPRSRRQVFGRALCGRGELRRHVSALASTSVGWAAPTSTTSTRSSLSLSASSRRCVRTPRPGARPARYCTWCRSSKPGRRASSCETHV